jgi:DNA-binding response OmpR family regulator
VHVQRLRAKIEDDPENPRIVQTVRGVGYRIGPESGIAGAKADEQDG